MYPLQPVNSPVKDTSLEEIQFVHFESLQDYSVIYQKMREFTLNRKDTTPDQIWLLEHHPVFTQGQAGKAEHILNPGNIPIVQSDRGGQVTYHGPGQIMVYLFLDLTRRHLNIRECVTLLENTVIALLKKYQITGITKPGAPGVYVSDAKIASIGLRVRKGYSYHGLCLNVAGDLTPFLGINPCGYENLAMTQIKDYAPTIQLKSVCSDLQNILKIQLKNSTRE